MKLREVLSLFTVVAILAPAAAASAAPFGGFAQNDSPDVSEVRHYALTLDKAQKPPTPCRPSTSSLHPTPP